MVHGSAIEDYFPPRDRFIPKRRLVDLADEICDELSPGDLGDDYGPKVHDGNSSQTYETLLIGELEPGPKRVTFMARIVNIYDRPTASSSPRAAKGCLKILAKDDTGCILVRV